MVLLHTFIFNIMYCILKIHAMGTKKLKADGYVHYPDYSNSITGMHICQNLTKL